MDAEHRHELKENDLARFIANLGEWWGRHGRNTLVAILIVLVVVAGWRWFTSQSTQAHDRTWEELVKTTNPYVFRKLAEDDGEPAARALANLWGAAAFNARASLPAVAAPDGAVDVPDREAEDRDANLASADAMLAKLLDDPQTPKLFRLNALLVRAAVQENRRDFEGAARTYKDIQESAASPGYEFFADTAGRRIELLEKLAEPVVFGPEPPAEPKPALNTADEAEPQPELDPDPESATTGADTAATPTGDANDP